MSEYLSGDQLYRFLHISKRKIKYLLENEYIPWLIRGRRPIGTGLSGVMRKDLRREWSGKQIFKGIKGAVWERKFFSDSDFGLHYNR